MIALAIVLTLTTGAVDRLGKVTLGGLTFKGPVDWQKSEPEENSIQWDEPESGAVMAITVWPVDPQRPAKACVQQMVDVLGKDGFAATTIAGQAASKKSVTDQLADPNAQPIPNPDGGEPLPPPRTGDKVTSTTLVGCNGKVKWLITWTAKTSEG
ncbi:MAG: hypothetical protein JNM17_32075, partial [Archangium sp.]|nr:hypothetical protein [Archangium sp.]